MKFQRLLVAGAIALSSLVASTAAQALTWTFSYSAPGITASGSFTTAGAALVAEDILSITGTRNGQAITGLVPVGSDPEFIYDNQFTISAPNFTDGGMLFSVAGGQPNTNVYFVDGEYFEVYVDDVAGAINTPITWAVTAVPEPSTALALIAGLGMVGVYMRKARAEA